MATIDFDPEDYLDEVDTDDLIDELRSRKKDKDARAFLKAFEQAEEFIIPTDISPRKLKEVLCDYLQLSHCSTNDEIITNLYKQMT